MVSRDDDRRPMWNCEVCSRATTVYPCVGCQMSICERCRSFGVACQCAITSMASGVSDASDRRPRCQCRCNCTHRPANGNRYACTTHCEALVCQSCVARWEPSICHWCYNPSPLISDVPRSSCRPHIQYKWRRLINRISLRKKWAVMGHLLEYSKDMPKDIDGKGAGLGKHIQEADKVPGRWGWREIRSEW